MSRVAASRPGPRPAKRGPAKGAPPRGAGREDAAPARFALPRPGPATRRWIAIAVILFALLVALPVIAAVLGEIWAMLLGALVAGFALGRATAR